jgi:hypothetical protein
MITRKITILIFCCSIFPFALVSCGSITRSAVNGDINGVSSCLNKGENINGYDKWGWTPLMWATYYGHYDLAKWMLDRGADPNARSREDYGSITKDSTPLIIAAAYGYGNLVRLFMNYKGDLSVKNRAGETVSSLAERNNFMDILILAKGAGKNVRNADSAVVAKAYDNREDESEEGNEVYFLDDGSKVVGKIVSQDWDRVTVRTRTKNVTIQRINILRSSIPYKLKYK